MVTDARTWKEVWWTPLGALTILILITLSVTTYVAMEGVEQRDLIVQQDREGRLRNEAVHHEIAELLECIVSAPGDLRNPNLRPEQRQSTQEFLDVCFDKAGKKADRKVPPPK